MKTNSSGSLLLRIVLFSLLLSTCFSKLHVDIFNRLPSNVPSLRLRCQSKDNDLGYHDLAVNQMYSFKFMMNFWGTTLFFCHFWWGGKQAVFNVFDFDIEGEVGALDSYVYEARPDGFYFWRMDPFTDKFFWQKVKNWEN